VLLETRLASVTPSARGLGHVSVRAGRESFDRVLVAVGRRANGDAIGLDALGVDPDGRGFVPVDAQLRTKLPHVFAIGDLTGPPLLAHRAAHQGKAAAEAAAGLTVSFDALAIPSVAYTDPEVAWVGLTEEEARRQGTALRKGVFPWSASGRALGMGRGEGLTKLLFAADDGRLVGAGMVGAHAGELVAEATLAIELGADAHDIGLTVHAHPTLSETSPSPRRW
jgi:dihydrolipoamide dehydrogenase